jgi:indole-3-glycerol phosphate synthase
MNILETIIAHKHKEVALAKQQVTIQQLEKMPWFTQPCLSLTQNLLQPNATGIIAEYKRQSPSKGIINNVATVKEVTNSYANNGAAAISVLTDEHFFGGHLSHLLQANKTVPLLRKDFVIDEYQLLQAKAYGASIVLLIAANLSVIQVKQLAAFAKNLGLQVLLEIHNQQELEHICADVDVVGVNNRNLKTFEVNIETSLQLVNQIITTNKIPITESGINNIETIVTLRKAGFKGFLIGEHFMKQANPTIAFAQFVNHLKQTEK